MDMQKREIIPVSADKFNVILILYAASPWLSSSLC